MATIRDCTQIIVDELLAMKAAQRFCPPLHLVYGHQGVQFMDIGRDEVVRRASEILRKKAGWTRAEAVEMAFDNLLSADKRWEREGEVVLLKNEGVARALCVWKEES